MNEVARLVLLASFLRKHSGIRVADAARAIGCTEQQLLADAERLSLCGAPPYSPNDYLMCTVSEGKDCRVQMSFAEHFARPLAFTVPETLALKYALEHFSGTLDPESEKHAAALRESLAQSLRGKAQEALADRSRGFVTPRRTARVKTLLGTLAKAAEKRQVLELAYYSSHRAQLGTRHVHPYEIIEHGARLYLYAHCELAGETRHFRVDRIKAANATGAAFAEAPPRKRKPGRMEPLFSGNAREHLQLRLAASIAQDVTDDWKGVEGVTITPLSGGRAMLELPLYNDYWAVGFIAGFGGRAQLVEPRRLRAPLAEALRRSLTAHGAQP